MQDPKHVFSMYRIEDWQGCLSELERRNYTEMQLGDSYTDFRVFIKDPPHSSPPRWRKILTELAKHPSELADKKNLTHSFVAFIVTDRNNYAFCGGHGSFAIQGFTAKQFGLEVAVRALQPDRTRNIRSKHLAGRTIQEEVLYRGNHDVLADSTSWEKLTKELISELGASSLLETFGVQLDSRRPVRMQAKEASFSIRRSLSVEQCRVLARSFDDVLEKEELFPLFFGYEEVRKKETRDRLKEQLLDELQKQYLAFLDDRESFLESTIGISIDDPVQLLLCESYLLALGGSKVDLEEFDLWTLFAALADMNKKEFSRSYLQRLRVLGSGDDGQLQFERTLGSMLYADIQGPEEQRFALVDSKWFLLKDDFRQRLDADIDKLVDDSQNALGPNYLPPWSIDGNKLCHEDSYIGGACQAEGLFQLHTHHVIIEGRDKGEVCDIYDRRAEAPALVFVKRGFGTRIKELLGQAVSSTEMLMKIPKFSEGASARILERTGDQIEPEAFHKCVVVLAVVDFSSRRSSVPLSEKLTTAVKLEILKAKEFIGELRFSDFYLVEIPQASGAQ